MIEFTIGVVAGVAAAYTFPKVIKPLYNKLVGMVKKD